MLDLNQANPTTLGQQILERFRVAQQTATRIGCIVGQADISDLFIKEVMGRRVKQSEIGKKNFVATLYGVNLFLSPLLISYFRLNDSRARMERFKDLTPETYAEAMKRLKGIQPR